jgi:tetratricopeptide (TPR) repeat protein
MPGEYWCEQARLALRARNYNTAIELANRGLGFEQRNPDLYFHLGEAHRSSAFFTPDRGTKRAHLEAAADAYRHSLAIFPFDEHVLVRLGQALDELERFAEAREAYETALRHDPNLGVLHAYFARHLARVGRADEAQEQSDRAAQLSAQNLRQILGDVFLPEPEAKQ